MTKRKKHPTIQKNDDDNTVGREGETPISHTLPLSEAVFEPTTTKPSKIKKIKSGKLVKSNTKVNIVITEPQKTNIILHLKCSLSDLDSYNENYNKQVTNPHIYNPDIPPEVKTYNEKEQQGHPWNNIDKNDFAYIDSIVNNNICKLCNATNDEKNQHEKTTRKDNHKNKNNTDNTDCDNDNIKEIQFKLKKLKTQLFKNILPSEKKSACFWCTYDFDNPECYIPRYEINGELFGYGCFCRPECAVSFLMKENIDDSTKFERYHLLNQIYSKIFDYKQNIKSAPNPYYMLEKFYGTLTIQEYRKLLNSGHLLLVIDKPMTRILPELHEDNEEIQNGFYSSNSNNATISNIKPNGVYKVKRQSEKQDEPSKTSIIREHFGLKT